MGNLQCGSMEKVAIFDIDGTLIKDISSERVFFRYLLRNRIVTFKDLLRYAGLFLKKLFLFEGVYLRRNKSYIRGKRYELLVAEARKCFEEELSSHISKSGTDEINRLKQKGYRIILLTGTLDPIMECFKSYCCADDGIGTTLEMADGNITGRIDGIYAYHLGKADIVRKLSENGRIDLANSYAFANESIDVDFMELVGNPVAVNPDPLLKDHALKEDWRIVEFK